VTSVTPGAVGGQEDADSHGDHGRFRSSLPRVGWQRRRASSCSPSPDTSPCSGSLPAAMRRIGIRESVEVALSGAAATRLPTAGVCPETQASSRLLPARPVRRRRARRGPRLDRPVAIERRRAADSVNGVAYHCQVRQLCGSCGAVRTAAISPAMRRGRGQGVTSPRAESAPRRGDRAKGPFYIGSIPRFRQVARVGAAPLWACRRCLGGGRSPRTWALPLTAGHGCRPISEVGAATEGAGARGHGAALRISRAASRRA
jgi:hypothetical protein